ncbi:hypothetical protein OESDEN_07697 [Oesophagostomum dentatum]|uniref:Uncharacterized protein n=1 Tax=Oesophagostomum dentatum TaxID=61180 RepID=A0A0B1T597_OESDE|nr:hypothetical protein OESDEN_07697 [Oesophagostomum dentatum]
MSTYPSSISEEQLQELSDDEWSKTDTDASADFLDLEKDEEIISVPSPYKQNLQQQQMEEASGQRKRSTTVSSDGIDSSEKKFEAIEKFSQLVKAVTALLNEDRVKNNGIEVHVSVRIVGSEEAKTE